MSLTISIKCLRSNFFVIVSLLGYVLFTQSSGTLGLQNTQKRTKDALLKLLASVFKYIRTLKTKVNYVFLKIEGAIKSIFFKHIKMKLIRLLNKKDIKLMGIQLISKIAHNGCRKSNRTK